MAKRQAEEVSLSPDIKAKILESTKFSSEFYDISESYSFFKKLDVEVTPRLEEIDFYSGHRAPEYDYAPESVETYHRLEKQRENRCRNLVELPYILNNFSKGQITFTGPAGSGKTTLLKATARNVMRGKYPNLLGIHVVHFIQCRDYQSDASIHPHDLLFLNVEPAMEEEEKRSYMIFARAHPQKVLFIIDSLDTLPYPLTGKHEVITVNQAASPATILWNILTGELFPNARVITSSREHTIRNYKGKLRADKIIALIGLTNESIRQIIDGYLDEAESSKMMQYLESKSPSLMSLCRNPAFLAFTLIGLDKDSKFKPSTMAGIMVLLLQSLTHSEHTHEENIGDVINKLKLLSFTGTKESRVLFSINELSNYDLSAHEVSSLAILAPGGRKRRLLEVDQQLFFCHQSVQETLTAFYVAEMELDDFETFLKDDIHSPHYAVIRRILCGILLDEEVSNAAGDLLHVKNESKKKQGLISSLENRLGQDAGNADQLELLISLHEAKEGAKTVIKHNVREIWLRDLPLSASDVHAIGSVMYHCSHLHKFWLQNCNLESASLETINTCISGSDVKISSMEITGNKTLGTSGMAALGTITRLCEVNSLNLNHCNLTSEELRAFREHVKGSKVSVLDLWGNKNMGLDGLRALGQITRECRLDSLKANICELTSEQILAFKENLRDSKVREMDISVGMRSDSASHDNVVAVITLFPNVTERLLLRRWDPKPRERKFLQRNLDLLYPTNLKIDFGPNDIIACEVTSMRELGELQQETFELEEKVTEEVAAVQDVHPAAVTLRDVEVEQVVRPLEVSYSEEKSFIEKEMDENGGDILIGDCRLNIPAGALEEKAKISARVFLSTKDNFDSAFTNDTVDITPILECKPRGLKFLKPVIVKMPTWVKASDMSKGAKPVIAQVLSIKRDDPRGPVCIERVQIGLEDSIEFSCQHFCRFKACIERNADVYYLLDYFLCSDANNNFSAVVCVSDSTIRQSLKREYLDAHYQIRIPPTDRISVKRNDRVVVQLLCDTPRFQFQPGDEYEFTADEDFYQHDKYRTFDWIFMREEGCATENASVKFNVRTWHDRSRLIRVPWHSASSEDAAAARHVTFHGDVRAETMNFSAMM